jgi:hypothetical protein
MEPYVITIEEQPGELDIRVTLRGPGIDPATGQHYVFISKERCRTFIQAVNFAYAQGLSDGLRTGWAQSEDPMASGATLMVSGRDPESLFLRKEKLGERIRRAWRSRWRG